MLNKIFLTLLMINLSVTVIGCSSSESESESKTESEIEALEPESDSTSEAQDGLQPEGDVFADLGGDDALKQDEAIDPALPETPVESADAIAEAPAEALAEAPTETLTETPAETMAPPPAEEPPAASSSSSGNEDLFGGSSFSDSPTEATPKPMVSLKKIKDMPYTEKGILANTVYVAREGDSIETVEQKTGATSKDLRKINSFLKRGVKVGDKIYYNSKNRPTDADRMLTYYEDLNIPPQTYTTKMGENIREISQQLLGHKDSWKEIWATNLDVQSKGALDEGTLLRYWPTGADAGAPSQTIAQNEAPPVDSGLPETPPPPPEVVAPGTVEPPPPPPAEPPPPPPAEAVAARPKPAKKADSGFVIPGLDQDTTFTVIGAVILFAGLAAIMVVRKSRARKLSSHTQTQI